jgi:hypothetical protein
LKSLNSELGTRNSELILIGTVHGDPRGYERLIKLLEQLRPEVVTVEISRFSVRYRGAWEDKWKARLQKALAGLPPGAAAHPAISMIAAQIALPFEYRAARDYERRNGAKYLPLDLGAVSRRHLPRYGELLSPANLQGLLETPAEPQEDQVAREFQRARLVLAHPPWRLAGQKSPETLRREFFLARRLKRLALKHGRIVHLGGWQHLVPWRDGDGMRAWLKEQKPLVILADEGDLPVLQEYLSD